MLPREPRSSFVGSMMLAFAGALLGNLLAYALGYGEISGLNARSILISAVGILVILGVHRLVLAQRGRRGTPRNMEITDLTSNTRRVAQQLPIDLAQFDSAVAAGRRPPLQPWIEPVRVQTHMWEASLQSGALALIDIPTVYRLSEFYNALNAGFEQLAQLRSLSESVLIPNLDRGSNEFYEPDGRHLRPKYQWYRAGLGRLAVLAATITDLGDSLTTQLASPQTRVAPQH